MFPLGTVLLPHALLPIHVFEPRYRALVVACLAGEHEFGVVLIERGSEVGGGDTRFSVGTMARIVQAGQMPDGRYVLATVGTRRIRVTRWLAEAPYPQAEVVELDEPAASTGDAERRDRVGRLLTRVSALRAEQGEPAAPLDVELDADPGRAAYEAAALAGIGPLDAQRVLEARDPATRLDAVAAAIGSEIELLELRRALP